MHENATMAEFSNGTCKKFAISEASSSLRSPSIVIVLDLLRTGGFAHLNLGLDQHSIPPHMDC
jgi:hypothetical protein